MDAKHPPIDTLPEFLLLHIPDGEPPIHAEIHVKGAVGTVGTVRTWAGALCDLINDQGFLRAHLTADDYPCRIDRITLFPRTQRVTIHATLWHPMDQ